MIVLFDVDPRELVNPAEDEMYHYEQEDRDRLTAMLGPEVESLDDSEVDRLLGIGRHVAMRLLGEVD